MLDWQTPAHVFVRNPEIHRMSSSKQPEVVVITGASAGVGRATVRAFARRGAHIALLARGREGLEGARRDVEALGGKALVLPTDVSDADAVEAAAEAAEKQLGPIDIWINDAMVSVFSPAKEMTGAEYKRVTEVTYLGFVYGTLSALRRMVARDRGMIVQVGSALAYRGIPLQSAYCGAKHAIQGFTESVRCELIHDHSNVKITMVQMPALNTPQFDWVKSRLPRHPQPVPPIFQPEVAADAIYHAAHHYRRQWFVGGPTVVAIQGNKVAPAFGDWYLAQQGYGAQQCNLPMDPNRPDNLHSPVDEDRDHGAHGDFDRRANRYSKQLLLDQYRRWIAGAGLLGAIYSATRSGPRGALCGGLAGLSLAALGVLGLAPRPRIESLDRLASRSGKTADQAAKQSRGQRSSDAKPMEMNRT
jgi:NAD(P)-dependent dehydrogenase (short-subunit alcohol dehydrogenase family)